MRDTWPMWLVAGVLAAFVGMAVWQEIAHPCIRSEDYACTRTYCSMYMPHHNPASGQPADMVCMVWTTVPDTCFRCVERAP